MNSHTTEGFRRAFQELPADVQRTARKAYRTFRRDPSYPGLRFKRIHPRRPIYSSRVGLGHRAVGIKESEDVVWFWIGSHADYDRLVARLSQGA